MRIELPIQPRPVHEPEVRQAKTLYAYAKNERGQNTLSLPVIKIEGPEISIDAKAWRLDSFTKGIPPKQKFLLDPLFPLGVAGVLFGPGGVGKSLVALDLCMALPSVPRWHRAT